MSDPNPEAAGAYIRLPKPKSAGWGGKALLVCLLALLMAIPGLFVLGLVHDRANRSEKVVAEVSDMRGGAQQVLAHLRAVGADGQLEVDALADDVVLGPAVDGADGDEAPSSGLTSRLTMAWSETTIWAATRTGSTPMCG